jgi:hypothetical protein
MLKSTKRRCTTAAAAAVLLLLPALSMAALGLPSGTETLNQLPTQSSDAGTGTTPGTSTNPTNNGPFCVSPAPCGSKPPGTALEAVTPAPTTGVSPAPSTSGTTPASGNPFDTGNVFVQSDAARRNPLSAFLRGPSDLSMWNLVAHVSAQKAGSAFVSIQTGLASLSVPLAAAPAAVPLPAAGWLFVAGVLGLARKRKAKTTGAA